MVTAHEITPTDMTSGECQDWAVAGGGELHPICFALASGQSGPEARPGYVRRLKTL